MIGHQLEYLVNIAYYCKYRYFKIPKKTGGYRSIETPRKPLKKIQKELSHYLQSVYYFERTDAAFGYVVNIPTDNSPRNILSNAQQHCRKSIALCLPAQYGFSTREHHPTKEIFNATINYFYGMLYSIVEMALFSVGFDVQGGILHSDTYGKPTLCYDMIEPFRGWIDRIAIVLFLDEQMNIRQHFSYEEKKGFWLNKKGKEIVIPLFKEAMQQKKYFLGRRMSIKHHIYRFASIHAASLKQLNEEVLRTSNKINHL